MDCSSDIGGGTAESLCDQLFRKHVLEHHWATVRKVADVFSADLVWDVYKEALSVQERQVVPCVGASIDRRSFEAICKAMMTRSMR